ISFAGRAGTSMLDVEAPPSPERPTTATRRPRWRISRNLLVMVALIAVIGYFTIGPVAYLINGTFSGDSGFTLEYIRSTYTAPGVGDTILTTVLYAVGSAVFAVVLGASLAFVVARTDSP